MLRRLAAKHDLLSPKIPWNLVLGTTDRRGGRVVSAVAVVAILLSFPIGFLFNHVRGSRRIYASIERDIAAYETSLARISVLSPASIVPQISRRFPELTIIGFSPAPNVTGAAVDPALKQVEPFSDPATVAAATAAAASGKPSLIPARQHTGARLLLPLYGPDVMEASAQDARRAAAVGWLVTEFDAARFFRSVVSSIPASDFEVVDTATGNVLIAVEAASRGAIGVATVDEVTAFGREWRISRTRRYGLSELLFGADGLAPLLMMFVLLLLLWQILARRRPLEFGERMLDALADVIVIIDREQRIVYVSPSVQKHFGRSPSGLRTTPFLDLLHPDSREAMRAALQSAASAQDVTSVTVHMFAAADSIRGVEVAIRKLTDRGDDIGFLLTLHDVTRVLQLSQQLEQTERVESLGRVAATIAHEFNNVLQGMQTCVDLLKRRSDHDEGLRALTDLMARNVARGRHIATGVLRFAHPAKIQSGEIDVREWIETITPDLAATLKGSQKLDVDIDCDDLFIAGDVDQLTQVLLNVVLNARDASDADGRIRIRVNESAGGQFSFGFVPPGDFVHLEIIDEGSGMPAEIRKRIFEPLYTTKTSGTGLGLAVSHQIITAHGGLIFVRSVERRGTEFHIFLHTVQGSAFRAGAHRRDSAGDTTVVM